MGLGMAKNLALSMMRHQDAPPSSEALRQDLHDVADRISAHGMERTCQGDYAGLRVGLRPPIVPVDRPGLDVGECVPSALYVWNRLDAPGMSGEERAIKRDDVERRFRIVEESAPGKVFRAESLDHLARECDAICLCVNNIHDVLECIAGLGAGKAGALIVDHATLSPQDVDVAAERARKLGYRYVAAPVTGAQQGALAGTLTLFLGGERKDAEEAAAICRPYTSRIEWLGTQPRDAQNMKMANQIGVTANVIGFCESLAYATKAGLDVRQAIRCIESGAGGSWVFTWYGPDLSDGLDSGERPPKFSIANHLKDCDCVLRSAEEIDAAVPFTQLFAELLSQIPGDERMRATTGTTKLYDYLLSIGKDVKPT